MKLDSIVYDYNSLQTAITEQLNNESPTFQAMYPSDTATSLVNVLASYGSMLQYQLVSAMANAYTDTAYSESGIYQLAETLGNRIHGNISAQVYCNITRTNLTGIENLIIPAGSKFTVESLNFFNPQALVFPLSTYTLTNVKLIQGVLLTHEQTALGVSGEKIYFCDDFKCNTEMVKVYVDGELWDITDSFLPYVVTETSESAKAEVCVVRTDPDGRTFVKFGNNSNGLVPAKGKTIRIEYIANEGANGNLNDTDLKIDLVTPIYYTTIDNKRERLTVDITALTTASGGFNTQDTKTLRESSPLVFASGNRAVRRNDYKAMLLNKCGYLTCNVWGEYEEATIQGGYDKIMMNMVYYTGIKSIQKYDLQPVMTLNLSPIEINNIVNGFYTIEGNVNGARGFLGSYIVDISSYDINGAPITLKYRDNNGTGILTCDPSINTSIDDLETVVFPVNDLPDLAFTIDTNQKWDIDQHQTDPNNLVRDNGMDYQSSGVDDFGQPTIINFNNPFQIRFNFPERLSLTAFAFKTPSTFDGYRQFIHKFAIYGTHTDIPTENNAAYYENVKNSSIWTKLTGIQTIDSELALSSEGNPVYSDWYTTNLYNPGSSVTEEEDLSDQIPEPEPGQQTVMLTSLVIHDLVGDNFKYILKINGETVPTDKYYISDNILTFTETLSVDPLNTRIILSGTLYDWESYEHYLIEVYALHDSSVNSPKQVTIGQIKALAKDSSSTINYLDNNSIILKLPVTTKENAVYGYTAAKTIPLSTNWLETEDGTTIEGSPANIYNVTDNSTHSILIEVDYGGNNNFHVGDAIFLPYYTNTVEIVNGGENYQVGETFTINDGKKVKVDITNPLTGAITKASFIGTNKYGNINLTFPPETSVEIDAGSYDGEGTNATFTITSSFAELDALQNPSDADYYNTLNNDMPGVIKFNVTEIENEYIKAISDPNRIIWYDPGADLINTTTQDVYAFDLTGGEANPVMIVTDKPTFRITSVPELTLYNDKTYRYAGSALSGTYYESAANTKFIGLPETMQYYEYLVTLNGITETNGYRTGNSLTYNILSDNIAYVFTIQIVNISTQTFSISLQTDNSYPSNVLRGKSSITIDNAPVTTITGGGDGGTISIASKSSVNVYCSYTGNFYTNSDIQASDLPIINKYNHFTTYLEFRQPHIKNVTIELNVEYENVTNYQTVRNNVITAVNELFTLHPYSIGSTLNVSDIWKAVNSVGGIKRFNVITPLDNIDSSPYELLMLPAENLIINDIINSEYK